MAEPQMIGGKPAGRAVAHLILILGAVIIAFPIWYVFIASTHSLQTILRPPQSVAQGVQGPGRRTIPRALRNSGDFGEDAPLRHRAIADPMTTPMARHHRGQAVAVEASHPARNGITRAAPNQLRRRRVALPCRHGQQGPGTGHLRCRGALGPAQP